jgi:hypothetical protein
MSSDIVLEELKKFGRNEAGKPHSCRAHLTEDDIQRWSPLIGGSRSALYDRIAVFLARGFHSAELEFEFCDAVANHLFGIITYADEDLPDIFWEIYLAFDAGEYYHAGNRDEDPVETYTRPSIARIIEKISPPITRPCVS